MYHLKGVGEPYDVTAGALLIWQIYVVILCNRIKTQVLAKLKRVG